MMRGFICWILLLTGSFIVIHGKPRFDPDFEFAEEDDATKILSMGGRDKKKLGIHDSNNELCRPLNCKRKEVCLLQDAFTAVCVSKKELAKSRDMNLLPKSRVIINDNRDDAFFDSEDDDDDHDHEMEERDEEDEEKENQTSNQIARDKCQECPVVRPANFLCGTDNRTYSSMCRLDYHACIHSTPVHVACKGFCPCKSWSSSGFQSNRIKKKFNQSKYSKSLLFGKLHGNNLHQDITLMPRHLNYNNHNYQYFKYGSGGDRVDRGDNKEYHDKYQEDAKHALSNEISKSSSSSLRITNNHDHNSDCPQLTFREGMANRLLDWFSVLMNDARYHNDHEGGRRRQDLSRSSKRYFSMDCQTEVRWMFGHLDTDGDGRISLSELYGLEHDQDEPCLKPFLDGCDIDQDGSINGLEWCSCFSKAERPCTAVAKRIKLPDVAPACDSRGYYQSVQCHDDLGICWCVDPHGVEFSGTRTRAGLKPNCDAIINKMMINRVRVIPQKEQHLLETNHVDLKDQDSNYHDHDDEDHDHETNDATQHVEEGSADEPLDF